MRLPDSSAMYFINFLLLLLLVIIAAGLHILKDKKSELDDESSSDTTAKRKSITGNLTALISRRETHTPPAPDTEKAETPVAEKPKRKIQNTPLQPKIRHSRIQRTDNDPDFQKCCLFSNSDGTELLSLINSLLP